jgi:hypothetical protein
VNEATPWSADPLAGEPIAAVEAMERAVTVDLIATFEPNLVCCSPTDEIDRLRSNPAYAGFDYLPVRLDDRIVGLLPLSEVSSRREPLVAETAERAMCALDQAILIASGTGVLRYMEEAEESPCRLVMRGTRIAGIVTISDLQKLPVRPALFLLITHLELLMAAVIRTHYRDRPDDDWLSLLGPRREKVERDWQDLNSRNMAVDRTTATQFADKRRILIESGLLEGSRTKIKSEFEAIERLRNSIAHASDYALTIDNACKTIRTAKNAQKWISCLQNLAGGMTQDTTRALSNLVEADHTVR